MQKVELQRNSLYILLEEFEAPFSQELGSFTHGRFKLHVKEGAKPVFCKSRPVPYIMRTKVEAEIDRLVDEGILTPAESSEWLLQ